MSVSRNDQQIRVGLLAGALILSLIAAIAVALDWGESDGPAVAGFKVPKLKTISPTISPEGRVPECCVDVLGGRLFGWVGRSEYALSEDGGKSWIQTSLPSDSAGIPDIYDGIGITMSVQPIQDVRAADLPVGKQSLFAWATTDGKAWNGGRVFESDAQLNAPKSFRVNDNLILGVSAGPFLQMIRSSDIGISWSQSVVSGLKVDVGETPLLFYVWMAETGALRGLVGGLGSGEAGVHSDDLIESNDDGKSWNYIGACPWGNDPTGRYSRQPSRCYPIHRAKGILVRGREASVDGGKSWVPVSVSGFLEKAERFRSVVALPDGGWLATISASPGAGEGDSVWVLRSDDGRKWQTLLGPGIRGCRKSPADTDEPGFYSSEPAFVGGRWILTFSCPAGRVAPGQSGRSGFQAVFVGDRRAKVLKPIYIAKLPNHLRAPLVLSESVVIPVVREFEYSSVRLTRFLEIQL